MMMLLLGFVILFTPDFIELENPKKAENFQEKYATLLAKYLKSKFKDGTAGSRLCSAMAVQSMCRELRELQERHWKV